MVNRFRLGWLVGLVMTIAMPTLGNAQDISLAAGGADPIWKGTQPNMGAGFWLDQGAVGAGDNRRDLIVGAPGAAGIAGTVFILFGGPERTGEVLLSEAQVIITSSEAGNRFGAATAAGNILIPVEGTVSRNLVIGAPGALGGNGAVYLMAAGFTGGTTTTEASATLRILGAAGDQLGTALATGDLDADGYREIIIGAPGNSRIYVVKGGPSLSGTLDLSNPTDVAKVARVYQAAGLGRVLTSGDITGDRIYDIVAGAPSANVAYIFAGAAGSIPAGATTSFSSNDGGDEVGAAVRILDLDANGQGDLVITAPGADGPSNDRPNAGEAYVYFGPVAPGPRDVAFADVHFFGAAPGMRLGDGITAGDINRDQPNDLVLLASGGGDAGAGRLEIYYGRVRGSIGVQQPDGRRFVDFSLPGEASRKVYGDPAAGPITSAQVFEVTGEGARDIIVGVAAADSGAGKLYFVISPKMRVTPTTLSLVANEGGSVTSPTPIQIINSSTVFIGWQATSNQPWLSASPSAGSADSTHPSSFLVTGASQGLAPGVHTGTITVASTSFDLEQSIRVEVTMTVTGTRMALDTPRHGYQVGTTFTVQGWALDVAATSGTGVSEVQVYAYPNPGSGQAGTALGAATYGGSRPDVGAAFGPQFTNSAYTKQVTLAPGTYQISVFAKSTVSGQFMLSKSAVVVVVNGTPSPDPVAVPDAIDPGPTPTTTLLPPPPPDPGGPNANTRVSVNRTSMSFGAIAGTNGLRSGPQQATVSFSNGSSSWTATTDAPWLQITGGSGTGAGSFSLTVRPDNYGVSTRTGTVTISAVNVPNSPITMPVTLRVVGAGGNPSGFVDTPADKVTGVTGAIAVTGWALDDIGVQEVTIYRDPIAGETSASPNGKIFISRAAFVDGARAADIDLQFDQPFDYQAGWGYMLLTNMLPNQGNGTFTLHAYATDVDGHTVLLGSRTITCANATATKPFGAIDTPDQGGTVSGTTYTSFGWALTPQPNMIPTDGSTIMVYIDGLPVGRPTYNNFRADIATLFPGYTNSGGAVGYYTFDTTKLSNGVHTISWVVTDNAGNSEGIGSRYFTVLNSSSTSTMTLEASASIEEMSGRGAETRVSAGVGASSGLEAASLEPVPVSAVPVYRRDGYNQNAALEFTESDQAGVVRLSADAAGRFTLTLSSPVRDGAGGYEGYMVAGGKLQALPAGSFLDQRSGDFYWQPGVGFNGTYRLVFIRTEDGQRVRIPVEVTIGQRPAPAKNERITK